MSNDPSNTCSEIKSRTENTEKDSEPAHSVELTYPDGGLRAWSSAIGGTLILFVTFGAVQSYGVYQDFYTRTFYHSYTPSSVSWIGSIQSFLLFGCSLPAGIAFDYGYFYHALFGGSALYFITFLLLSFSHPGSGNLFQPILAQGVGIGLAMGSIFIPSLSLSSHYFLRKRATANGVIFAGSSIGGIVFPILLNNLISRVGFAWAIRITNFIILLLLILALIIMRPRLPGRREDPNAPAPNFKLIFTDVGWWFCTMGGFFVLWGLFFPFFYLQLFASLHGVPNSISKYIITILNASSLFGRTVPNMFADTYGAFNTSIPLTYIAGALVFAMLGTSSTSGIIVFAILYGFFSGGFISLITADLITFSTSPHEAGTRVGSALLVFAFALLTGTPISGALLHPPHYTWWRAVLFSGVAVLTGATLLLIARKIASRRLGRQRL